MGQVIFLSERKKRIAPEKTRVTLTPFQRAEIEELGIILFDLKAQDDETRAIGWDALRQCEPGTSSISVHQIEARRRKILATIEKLLSKENEYGTAPFEAGEADRALVCLERFKQIRKHRSG